MTTQAPDEFVSVPLPSSLYLEVAARHPRAISAVIEQVVWDFLDQTKGELHGPSRIGSGGVAWGATWLPEGTELRTRYFGKHLQAVVRYGRVVCEAGEFVSVAQAANAMRGGTSNNAWQVMEVKRPGEDWGPASRIRQ